MTSSAAWTSHVADADSGVDGDRPAGGAVDLHVDRTERRRARRARSSVPRRRTTYWSPTSAVGCDAERGPTHRRRSRCRRTTTAGTTSQRARPMTAPTSRPTAADDGGRAEPLLGVQPTAVRLVDERAGGGDDDGDARASAGRGPTAAGARPGAARATDAVGVRRWPDGRRVASRAVPRPGTSRRPPGLPQRDRQPDEQHEHRPAGRRRSGTRPCSRNGRPTTRSDTAGEPRQRGRIGTDDERQPQRAVQQQADTTDDGQQHERDAHPQRVDRRGARRAGRRRRRRCGPARRFVRAQGGGRRRCGVGSSVGGARSTPSTVRTFAPRSRHRGCPWSIPDADRHREGPRGPPRMADRAAIPRRDW